MKRLIIVFVVCFVFVACSEEIQPLKSLQKGMTNTVTLSTGNVVYDLNGEWDAIIDAGAFGTFKEGVKITQQGNKFVGISTIGNPYRDKGTEMLKGELEKNGFKSIERITGSGWISSTGKIDEGCNKIVVKTEAGDKTKTVGGGGGTKVITTLTRK